MEVRNHRLKPVACEVVNVQTCTSLNLKTEATRTELKERPDTSLVWTPSAEPLNAMPRVGLSSVRIGEGKHDHGHRDAIVTRVPTTSADGTPLMPCKPAKARKLLRDGKAVKQWNKLGIFHIRLTFNPAKPATQPLTIGVDPGSKFEGLSITGTEDTVLNIMSEATCWVKKALEQRREMRRARRHRNTRRRERRINNRPSKVGRLPPSTKARWDAKLRIITQLEKNIPVQRAIVEDIKAETGKGQRRWNENFSPLEAGKKYFYQQLRNTGLTVETRIGIETQELRKKFNLKKINDKSRPVFESHCVDAWVLAAATTGTTHPTTRSLHYLTPLRWHRRQLHKLQAAKGGVRRREGGTMSLGLKKGTLVKHFKYGICYVGGNMHNKLSLHSAETGKRLTQHAKREDLRVLTRTAWRTRFLHELKPVASSS